MKVTTAVFPVAGLGTRFLPVTKTGPKEMLPIINRPLIQYAVQEAIDAGIKRLIFITTSGKYAIENYFDHNFELEDRLKKKGKAQELGVIKDILPKDVTIAYVRQSEPLGLGHAILQAKNFIDQEPFAVLLADDVIDNGEKCCLQEMIELHTKTHANILAVEQIPYEKTELYGIVSLNPKSINHQINAIVEKPAPKDAPSQLAVIGRYILTPRIFNYLTKGQVGVGGEIQLTDAIADILAQEEVYAFPITGTRYDCGSCLGFIQATLAFAMKQPKLREELKKFIKSLDVI